jgi:hypothetical protein
MLLSAPNAGNRATYARLVSMNGLCGDLNPAKRARSSLEEVCGYLARAGQPAVAIWEPTRNHRLTRFPPLQSAEAALSVKLLKIKHRQKPKQLKKNLSRRSPHGPNISTVENSNFTVGLGPIRSGFSGYGLSLRIGRKTAYLQQSIRTIIGPCLGAHRRRCSHLRVLYF